MAVHSCNQYKTVMREKGEAPKNPQLNPHFKSDYSPHGMQFNTVIIYIGYRYQNDPMCIEHEE